MNESGRSQESDLVDHVATRDAAEHDQDAAVPPALPRRARAVPVDAPPVFERAVLEPLEPEGAAAAPTPHRAAPASAASVLADLTHRSPASPPTTPPPAAPATPSVQISTPVPLRLPTAPPSSPLPPPPAPVPPIAAVPLAEHVAEPVVEPVVQHVAEPVAEDVVDPVESVASVELIEPVEPVEPLQAPAAAAAPPAPSTRARELPADDTVPHTVIFKPRRATRRALTSVLVVWIAASVVSVIAAWREPSQPTIGIAGAIILLTAVTWVARGGASVARLTVRGGMLEIRKPGERATFSLSDSYQLIEVVGKPGSMGWKVLFRRKDAEPYVVDGAMVDPKAFMRVLTYYRPQLGR